MTDKIFEARVANIAARRGVTIRPLSLSFVSKTITAKYLHGSLDQLSDTEVFRALQEVQHAWPTQFGGPSPLARKSAEQRLDEENAKAATRAEQTPPTIPGKIDRAAMSEKERAAFDKLTVEQKLSFANDKAAEFLAKKKAQKS